MKETLKKIASVCKCIFGYAILICLIAGALTAVAYVVAIIAGGDVAAAICNVVYKKILPVIFYATSSTVLFGLVTMYLGGEVSMTIGTKKKAEDSAKK